MLVSCFCVFIDSVGRRPVQVAHVVQGRLPFFAAKMLATFESEFIVNVTFLD